VDGGEVLRAIAVSLLEQCVEPKVLGLELKQRRVVGGRCAWSGELASAKGEDGRQTLQPIGLNVPLLHARQQPFFIFFIAMLFQGEPFAEFREEWDNDEPPPIHEAARLINIQAEIIDETLNQSIRSSLCRRQAIAYLLEQCVLLCAALPSAQASDRRRFRRIRRLVESARRIARGDGL
jgi:hypothetical protein